METKSIEAVTNIYLSARLREIDRRGFMSDEDDEVIQEAAKRLSEFSDLATKLGKIDAGNHCVGDSKVMLDAADRLSRIPNNYQKT